MYALITNNAVSKYPYTVRDLATDNPRTSFPDDVATRTDIQQSFGMYAVQSAAKPSYDPLTQKVTEGTPVLVSGKWTQVWTVSAMTDAEKAAAQAALYKQYDTALMAHFDTTAQAKNYQDRISCAVRAGYPGPFHNEGVAFASWMDNCNAQGYALLAEVQAGTKPLPTITQFIAALPSMVWPT